MDFLVKFLISILLIKIALLSEASFKPKLVHLSYEKLPEKIYKNQIFHIDFNSLIAIDKFSEITTSFSNSESVKILNPNNSWSIKDNNHIYNRFYFKALKSEIELPDMTLNIHIDSNKIESDKLDGVKLKTSRLYLNSELFSKVLAKEFKLERYKVNRYDDRFNIIVLEIETEYGNLEDFHLDSIEKQGIESIQYSMPYSKAFYFAVIPNHLNRFEFSYFNLKEMATKKFSLKIIVDKDQVSTQSDLNPIDSDYTIYKVIFATLISISTIILFIFRKRYIYIVIATLGIGYIGYILMPQETIEIKQGSNIYLLPTKNSTIFSITKDELSAKKLKVKRGYIKILLPSSKVGWIRREDVKD